MHPHIRVRFGAVGDDTRTTSVVLVAMFTFHVVLMTSGGISEMIIRRLESIRMLEVVASAKGPGMVVEETRAMAIELVEVTGWPKALNVTVAGFTK